MSAERMTEADLECGRQFEDWACGVLWHNLGFATLPARSKEWQIRSGETAAGASVEFKRDMKASGSKNFFVEYEETHAKGAPMHPAGPYHEAAPVWMCFGDVGWGIVLVSTKTLKRMLAHKKYSGVPGRHGRANGFLVPMDDMLQIADLVWWDYGKA